MIPRQTSSHVCSGSQLRGTCGLIALAAVSFLVLLELPSHLALILGGCQVASLTVAVAATLRICCCVPSRYLSSGSGKVCSDCQRPALNGDYHCDICDLCVSGHSHHSIWLSTCIGAANLHSYLVCLLGLGTAAVFQIAAGVAILVVMLNDREEMLRINEKYSMSDGGYFFHLILEFSVFVSVSVALSCYINFTLQVCKYLKWKRLQRLVPIAAANRSSLSVYAALKKTPKSVVISSSETTARKRIAPALEFSA